MSSSLPFVQAPAGASSFWSRESSPLKQGIKTGLAGTITYAVYAGWNLPQGYWAVLAALVVTQVNVGASSKAAVYRIVGTTCGALAAALLLPLLGTGAVRAGIALFLLASFFAYLTAVHPMFSAAGFTSALILVFGGAEEPWRMAWLRVLYTLLGAVISFLVGFLIWPVRAREGLRDKIADILEGAGILYSAVTTAALQGVNNELQIRQLSRHLHDLRRGITQQMEEARSELGFARFQASAFEIFVGQADQLRRRLTAMAEDTHLYVIAKVQPTLLPCLPLLVSSTARAFADLSEAVHRRRKKVPLSDDLTRAVRDLERDLARLREQHATAPFALDRMLPFWSFAFNLREIAEELKQLQIQLAELD